VVKFIIVGFLVWLILFAIGALGWAQIQGSLQDIAIDKLGFLRIIVWVAIFVIEFFVVRKFFWQYKWVYLAAMILSFIGNGRRQY